MKALEQKILREGTVLEGDVLKVGSFFIFQIDTGSLLEMADEVCRIYAGEMITKILTIEASGIALAVAVAAKMNCKTVFAKKNKTSNVSGEVFFAKVHSYTHGADFLKSVA